MFGQTYLKQFKYEAINESKNEVYGHNVFFKNIINRPIDIFCVFESIIGTETIQMKCAIDIGASKYLKSSDNAPEVKEQEKMVKDFAMKMTKAPFEALLATAISTSEKLIKENISLEKEIKEAKENLIDLNKKVIKLQKDSVEKSVTHQTKNQEVDAHKKIMVTITIKESAFSVSTKKTHDKLLGQKNSAETDVNELNSKIKIVRDKLTRTNTDIKVNGEFILKNNKEIENQKIISEMLKKKLEQVT